MSLNILNREFQHPADGWYQIEARGYHPATDDSGNKVVQVIDDKAVKVIVARFNADAASGKLPGGNEMLIDHEHFSHDPSKETIAYGWATKLRISPDGSGFDVFNPWTNTGKTTVDGGDYRFFSTEYALANDGFETVPASEIPNEIRNKYPDYRFIRPLELTGLSLTNCPNNKGQSSITNRRTAELPGNRPLSQDQTAKLTAWFKAVAGLQATRAGSNPISFQAAWDLCKKQQPEAYAAAFGSEDGIGLDTDKAAAEALAGVTNRVRAASGKGFEFAWNFVRRNLPGLCNRKPCAVPTVFNRVNDEGRNFQKAAATLFNRQVNADQLATRISFAESWKRVSEREPVLKQLADGRCSAADAFSMEPALRSKISG